MFFMKTNSPNKTTLKIEKIGHFIFDLGDLGGPLKRLATNLRRSDKLQKIYKYAGRGIM